MIKTKKPKSTKKSKNVNDIARKRAERYIERMELYVPQAPEIPDELQQYTADGKYFIAPCATDLTDEELGCAISYMNSLAEFVESQLAFLEVELKAVEVERNQILDSLMGHLRTDRGTKVTLEKAKIRNNPELVRYNRVLSRLEGQHALLSRFLSVYDRKCQALSRELTRRGNTTARWERTDRY